MEVKYVKDNDSSIKAGIIYLLFSLFIMASVASYTQLGDSMKIFKSVFEILIIFITITNLKLKKFKWVEPLILIFIIYPLILLGLNIYNLYPFQVVIYVGMLMLNLIFYVCVAEYYHNKLDDFIKVWQNALFSILVILLVIYRGISLNVSYMLHATITNNRYGGDLLFQRYSMGFTNVNQLALFSSLLFISSIYFLFKKKRICFSSICLVLSFIFICNSESRSPFVAIGITIIFMFFSRIKIKPVRNFFKWMLLFFIIIFSIFFALCVTKGISSMIYQELNSISSMRLYFSTKALDFVRSVGSIWFGVGPMSTSFVTTEIFGNNLTLDSSIGYNLFSFGIVGTIIIFTYIFLLLLKEFNNNEQYLVIYFIVYAMFENSIFIPSSLLSCFGCIILFIFMRMRNDSGQ